MTGRYARSKSARAGSAWDGPAYASRAGCSVNSLSRVERTPTFAPATQTREQLGYVSWAHQATYGETAVHHGALPSHASTWLLYGPKLTSCCPIPTTKTAPCCGGAP